jgi:hypothetical protein
LSEAAKPEWFIKTAIAFATAGAIRARPVLPVVVSILVVIFAMFELIILPGFYTAIAPNQPIVNGSALGLTVKTDGAAMQLPGQCLMN